MCFFFILLLKQVNLYYFWNNLYVNFIFKNQIGRYIFNLTFFLNFQGYPGSVLQSWRHGKGVDRASIKTRSVSDIFTWDWAIGNCRAFGIGPGTAQHESGAILCVEFWCHLWFSIQRIGEIPQESWKGMLEAVFGKFQPSISSN